jgi:molecular chaperone GrpE (heat shock protein)
MKGHLKQKAMETKEKTVRKLTTEYKDLSQRYEMLHADYEEFKNVYTGNPTFTNYRKLHAIHNKLIKCSKELCNSQSRLIDAYWISFGLKHWQFHSV